MQIKQGRPYCNPLVKNKERGRAIRFAMMVATFVVLTNYHSPGLAADNWEVEGAHGVLHVHGSLNESACRMAMTSAWQDVPVEKIETSQLRRIGERGKPAEFELRLEDCAAASSRSRDSYTGNVTWSDGQPTVSISFHAPLDMDNPQLIKVSGANGFGLRLTDRFGRDVRIGDFATPLPLEPGQNQLIYTITPERTRAGLIPGNWWSQIDIGLSYE